MDKKQAIEYLQLRLVFLNNGHKVLWSLTDRAAVSTLCIDAVQQSVEPDAGGVIMEYIQMKYYPKEVYYENRNGVNYIILNYDDRKIEHIIAAKQSAHRTGPAPAHRSICPECLGPDGEHSDNCSLRLIR